VFTAIKQAARQVPQPLGGPGAQHTGRRCAQ
jgi:hypothetical protein